MKVQINMVEANEGDILIVNSNNGPIKLDLTGSSTILELEHDDMVIVSTAENAEKVIDNQHHF